MLLWLLVVAAHFADFLRKQRKNSQGVFVADVQLDAHHLVVEHLKLVLLDDAEMSFVRNEIVEPV